jgi:hypothetical protein
MARWRLSGTVSDKVTLFLAVVANLLCTVGCKMTKLLAVMIVDLAHILTFPASIGCIGNWIRVGILLERSLCEKTLLFTK